VPTFCPRTAARVRRQSKSPFVDIGLDTFSLWVWAEIHGPVDRQSYLSGWVGLATSQGARRDADKGNTSRTSREKRQRMRTAERLAKRGPYYYRR